MESIKSISKIRWRGLEADIYLHRQFNTIEYHKPVKSLSSAVLCGGYSKIRRALNLKVQANPEGSFSEENESWDPPDKTLMSLIETMDWSGPVAGMMTSALMESFRFAMREEPWGGVFCALTAGLSNARAAGDKGDFHPEVKGEMLPSGTINIMIGTNASLSEAALAEAIMIATEAKASVLSRYEIKSPVSGDPATGTGTDSIIISSGYGPEVSFCGKHTKIGELMGATVIDALSSSVEYLISRKN